MTAKKRSTSGKPSLDARLATLRIGGDVVEKVRAALEESIGLVIEIACRHLIEFGHHDLEPMLAPAFVRLVEDGTKRDPGCRGKIAIAKTLDELVRWEDDVFVTGLRVEQREGWGGRGGEKPEDTAASLRGLCAIAHARFARLDVLDVCATLLADPEPQARIGAAQAIGDAGRRDGTSILRYYLLANPSDRSEVLSTALESLLSLGRDDDRTIPWVIGLLARAEPEDSLSAMAALALGGARLREAYDPILAWIDRLPNVERLQSAYLPIALMRSDEGNAYLVDAIAKRAQPDAIAAASALATFASDPAIEAAIREVAATRDARLRDAILAVL